MQKLNGWVDSKRDLGNVVFLILRNRDGFTQITAKTGKVNNKIVGIMKKVPKESVISVEGKVVKNKQAPNGFEVIPSKIEVISESESVLPLEVSGKVNANLDTRLDNRFLDLRKPENTAVFKIQSEIQHAFGDYLRKKGFLHVQPPSLIASASEGGADLFAIPYYNKEAFLAQSPQLYKQMAVVGGLEKVWMIVPVWRAELSHTTQHLTESRQMDIEMGFATDNEVMNVLGDVVQNIFKEINKNCSKELKLLGVKIKVPKTPLRRVTYTKVLEMLRNVGMKIKWGEDLPTPAEKKICELIGWDTPFLITEWPIDIRSFYCMPDSKNPKICRAFDLMYKGIEINSGAQRIHIPELLSKRLKAKGLNPDNFKDYIDAMRFGAPYHGGWSIGLERITMAMLDLQNIRESVLFARDPERITP